MLAFFVFTIVCACVCAAPQYGYEQPANLINSGSADLSSPLSTGAGSIGNGLAFNAAGRGGDKYLPPQSTTQAPLINKKFYLISAPEDHSNDNKVKHLVLGRPQRNYRVVFIKAPSSDNANVKYSAEFAPQEEKTVIYVLSKKDTELQASDISTPAPIQPSKPEVFFIKYKSEEEAQQAQREIQGQYDKLGGTNEFSEDTNAPVTSIAGSLDGVNSDGSYNYRQINSAVASSSILGGGPGVGIGAPNVQYLPAGAFKY